MFLVGIISYSRARFPFPETHFPGDGVASLPFFFQDFGFFGFREEEQYPPGSFPGLFFFSSFPFSDVYTIFTGNRVPTKRSRGEVRRVHRLFFTACFCADLFILFSADLSQLVFFTWAVYLSALLTL